MCVYISSYFVHQWIPAKYPRYLDLQLIPQILLQPFCAQESSKWIAYPNISKLFQIYRNHGVFFLKPCIFSVFLLTIVFFQYRRTPASQRSQNSAAKKRGWCRRENFWAACCAFAKSNAFKKVLKKNCSICSFDSTASSFWWEVSSCEACGDAEPQYVEPQGSGRGKPLEDQRSNQHALH